MILCSFILFFFFFNDTATTEIYTLSLHDALPILTISLCTLGVAVAVKAITGRSGLIWFIISRSLLYSGLKSCPHSERSEEHTSELQSRSDLVCRLLLEKKNNITNLSQSHYSSRDA